MKGPVIVVGIDFGTTFSGAAWATEGCPDDLEVVSVWPGGQNKTSEKVPTVMSYEIVRDKTTFRWGFQVSPSANGIHGLKLLLDDGQANRYGPCQHSKDLLKSMRKGPVEVAAEFLRELLAVVKLTQVRRLGETYVNAATIRVVLTVPAVWSDKAKDATLRAAESAGLNDDQLVLVFEPEAAALYTLRAIQPNTIANGDTFVVCDAGGGTVDLITYRVKSVEPLDLDEVVKGDGGICGAAMLDRRFEEFIQNKLGAQFSQLSAKGKQAMLSSWTNNIKFNFTGVGYDEDELTEYLVVVPSVGDNPGKGIEDGMMLVDSGEIAAIFEPVIKDVEELVNMQIVDAITAGHSPKAVLLVGGFGSSMYLYRRICASFSDIIIMQPPNAWTSVVRGAVLRGVLGNTVSSRKARRHYGVSAQSLFDPTKHPNKCKEWNSREDEWKAKNRMSWFVSKGMELLDGNKISLQFYRLVPTDKPHLIFEDELLSCNDDASPDDSKDLSIFSLCTLKADLTKVPIELFQLTKNKRMEEFYKVNYQLDMSFTSASIFFELVFEGISYGSVRAKF